MAWLSSSGSGPLVRSQSDASWVCSHLKLSDGKSTSKVAHSHGQQADTGNLWAASVSLHVGLSTGLRECHHGMVTGFPQNEKAAIPLDKPQKLHTITSITYYWSHRPALIHRVVYTRWRSPGIFLEAGYHILYAGFPCCCFFLFGFVLHLFILEISPHHCIKKTFSFFIQVHNLSLQDILQFILPLLY